MKQMPAAHGQVLGQAARTDQPSAKRKWEMTTGAPMRRVRFGRAVAEKEGRTLPAVTVQRLFFFVVAMGGRWCGGVCAWMCRAGARGQGEGKN